MSSANQELEGKDLNPAEAVDFRAVISRIEGVLEAFAGDGQLPRPRSDDYTYAAALLHFAERLAAYRTERRLQQPPRPGYAHLPAYLRVYLDRWVRSTHEFTPFGGIPSAQNPQPTKPQGHIHKPGDDTPPDLLGWAIYIITRPDVEAPDRTNLSGSNASSECECDEDGDSGDSGEQSTKQPNAKS
jgi:hypothetical protein